MIVVRKYTATLLLIVLIWVGASLGLTENQNKYPSPSIGENSDSSGLSLSYIPNIVHDGVITADEYEYSFVQHTSPNYIVYYTINRSVIYMALEVEAKGWIRIGFGYYSDGDDADIIVGYFDANDGTTHIQDSYADGYGNHNPDAVDNIISYAGSENDSSTILEFSRKLDTGDYPEDYEIVPGEKRTSSWAFHDTADDFITPQNWQDEGSRRISFNGEPSAPYDSFTVEGEGKVDLFWTRSKGDGDDTTYGSGSITHYNIYRSQEGSEFQFLSSVPSVQSYYTTTMLSYTDTEVIGGGNYTYAVTAVTPSGESGYSNIAEAVPIKNSDLVSTISHDGVISPGEYEYFYVLQGESQYIMHYSIIRSTLYVALEIDAKGWVRVGFGYYTSGNDADIFVGYYDANDGTTHTQDSYADGYGNHNPDAVDNILSYAGSETGSKTILEFNRSLVTGDLLNTGGGSYLDDYDIIPGKNLGLSWAYHDSADDFTTPQMWQNRGSLRVSLNGDPGAPLDVFAIANVGKVDLIWNAPKGDGNGTTPSISSLSQYNIYRSQNEGNFQLIGNLSLEDYYIAPMLSYYTDYDVINGDNYSYFITAVTPHGESGNSNIVKATPSIDASPHSADGVITPGEYKHYTIIRTNPNFIIYYTIIKSTIYVAVEVEAKGWVSIGLYYFIDMGESDIIIGYYDTEDGTSHIEDSHAIGSISHGADGNNDLLTGYVGETNTTTIMEFSRLLDTGDDLEDYKIIPNDTFKSIWGAHTTADDFYSYHDNGYLYGNSPLTFLGPPEAPYNFYATVGEDQVNLYWDRPRGLDGFPTTAYNIYRAHNGGEFQLIDTVPYLNYVSYVDSGVITGEVYTYYMTAVNEEGESGDSATVSVIPIGELTAPMNLNILPTSGQVELTWDDPINDGGLPIEEYIIYRSDTYDGEYLYIGTNTSANSFIDQSIVNGLSYNYMVRAAHRILIGEPSVIVNATPVGDASPPLNLIITSGDLKATINWTVSYSDGGYPISGYNIYRSADQGGPYTFIGTNTSALGYTDETAENAKTYYYVVTAINSFGESGYSSEQRVTLENVPYTPVGLTILGGNNEVYLEWSVADGRGYEILNYFIYRSSSIGERYQYLGSTNLTHFTDLNVENGKAYLYVVTAINTVGESSYSSQINGLPGSIPSSPLNYSGSSLNGDVKIVWNQPENNGGYFISYYNIYRSTTLEGTFEKIGTSYSREFIDTNVLIGTTYYYIISGVNTLGEGVLTDSFVVTPATNPDAPQNLIINVSNEGIEINWDEPYDGGDDITHYNVYRSSVSGGSYDLVGITLSTSFIDTTFESGRIYFYVVDSSNFYGESDYSDEVSIISSGLPSSPENLIGIAGDSQVILNWEMPEYDGSSQITAYNIYRSNTDNGSYSIIGSVLNLVFSDNTVENNKTYYYVITAQNINGESNYSKSISLEPVASEIRFNFNSVITNNNTNNIVTISEKLEVDQIMYTSLGVFGLTSIIGLLYMIRRKLSLS